MDMSGRGYTLKFINCGKESASNAAQITKHLERLLINDFANGSWFRPSSLPRQLLDNDPYQTTVHLPCCPWLLLVGIFSAIAAILSAGLWCRILFLWSRLHATSAQRCVPPNCQHHLTVISPHRLTASLRRNSMSMAGVHVRSQVPRQCTVGSSGQHGSARARLYPGLCLSPLTM